MQKFISTISPLIFKRSQYTSLIFLSIFIIISIISITLYNNLREKVNLEYQNLLSNTYFKKSVNKLFTSTKPRYSSIKHIVENGETLNSILSKYKISKKESSNIIEIFSKKKIKFLKTGIVLNLLIDNRNDQMVQFIYPLSKSKKIVLDKSDNLEFSVKETIAQLEKKIIFKEGTIISSLYRTAKKLNMEDKIIVNFANIYGFQIDFQRDIYKNDTFQVMYENYYNEEENISETGNIIYANLILRGQSIPLYYFDDGKSVEHYDLNGTSVKKALMKTPINGARLSSPFGMRKHPILGFNKMHRGTDFAAPMGTPVMASGDGVIIKASWCGGGGNCIKIKHNSTYQTVYAHLSKFASNIKRGLRVKQAQIIGYVGSTGMSTGPHLHYEVIKNGKKINSQKLKLPSGKILKGSDRKNFELARIKIDVTKAEIIDKIY
tara:strand:- start:393 stop:1697 length:1305 start_codon:yes stop_codon:yes gene_type:complete